MTLVPHVTLAADNVRDVIPHGDGYAVLSSAGIEILDANLGRTSLIEGQGGSKLLALGDGRFLSYSDQWSKLHEGKPWGTLAVVDLGDEYVKSVVRTEGGFHAITAKGVLVDHGGTRTTVVPAERIDRGGCAWRGGSATAGSDGLAILASDGTIVTTIDMAPRDKPVALATTLAVPESMEVVLCDGQQVIARIPRRAGRGGIVPFRDGLLVHRHDDDPVGTTFGFWGIDGVNRWEVEIGEHTDAPIVIGDRIALASYPTNAYVYDPEGKHVAGIRTQRVVQELAAFGDGVAIYVRDTADALWWRPGKDLEKLEHDAAPDHLWSMAAGLMSSEGNALYLWRPDVPGPAWTPVATEVPMNEPIVISGIVTITKAGRFALRGETPNGRAMRLPPDVAWRPLLTREEALKLVERLIARTFDTSVATDENTPLSFAQRVDLVGRSLFEASTIPEEARFRVAMTRDGVLDELGYVLGISGRALLAAVKARKLKLEPPRPVAKGYEYLGTFTTSGDLSVADPCQIGKKQNPVFPLAVRVQGLEGVWHAFATSGQGMDSDRTGEFVAIHDDGFDVHANEPIGSIGIDSGTAGVFDKKCPKREGDQAFGEGTYSALGAFVSSGYGDGFYGVYTGNAKGRVAKIRIHFIGDEPDVDRSIAKVTTAARPYSPKTQFAMGDTIEHVKFGTGSVIKVGVDGKIDVRFADGDRTLVHAKK